MSTPKYDTFMGHGPKQILHWEHWSCPDAETYITGIDYYEHPKLCRERMKQLYPQIDLPIPATDEPRPPPRMSTDGVSSDPDRHTVRWGDSESGSWVHGEGLFKTAEDVFAFSPLAKGNFTDMPVVETADFSSEELIYQRYRKWFPADAGDRAPAGSDAGVGFYNTMFMWPLLTFGWELFLECCLDPRFARIMDEFAELNRRVFRAFARLPINIVICHDDIVTKNGLVCPPAWMRRFIYSPYEEFWSILKAGGKRAVFMSDGCMDPAVDDVMACGALGISSEPFTDYKAVARRYPNPVLGGEGDVRVLLRNNPAEIRTMVASMAETGRMSGGYFMCIGNHIPWNTPPAAVKLYLDLCAELGVR